MGQPWIRTLSSRLPSEWSTRETGAPELGEGGKGPALHILYRAYSKNAPFSWASPLPALRPLWRPCREAMLLPLCYWDLLYTSSKATLL